ncbi:hypothetical protein TNCV_54691 [Trichonephila clavipes]|nr:hypothetical protein TNCV_54691 [Trichonephila clavipes]
MWSVANSLAPSHSKVSLLLDSHFPSGSSPIPLVFNDCSPQQPSCLSPSLKLKSSSGSFVGGKAPGIDLIGLMLFGKLFITPSPTCFFDSFTFASNLITSLPFLRTQKLNIY